MIKIRPSRVLGSSGTAAMNMQLTNACNIRPPVGVPVQSLNKPCFDDLAKKFEKGMRPVFAISSLTGRELAPNRGTRDATIHVE